MAFDINNFIRHRVVANDATKLVLIAVANGSSVIIAPLETL